MTTMTVPGITVAEERSLRKGAREFFARQGTDVLAEFMRRQGGNTLPGDFGALTEPAAPHAGPGGHRVRPAGRLVRGGVP